MLLRRLFLPVLLLASLAGFFSVAYLGCNRDTYLKVIADRAYLVAKSREQLSASFSRLALALLIWGLLLAAAFALSAKREQKRTDYP